ncbi:hypothetical protein J2X11_001958 [Aeromicrobium panaciterrae]|uniref:DUF4190 domain-containing protein n=1 Tax=Aeromicrobium panaciterrae TaxID=363861 RepID=A0ABU1UPL5_9ACTN|nr:DUF4190 domain-containing protein [Aeromicrobium panaciterrae]MDR7087119.1 hypothetical protein [Aeromicrobium panaciterrae]
MTSEPVPSSDPPAGGDRRPVNRKAIYSVICGFGAFLVLWVFPFGAFALGVPAVTTGVHGRREIKLSRGSERGDTVAIAGLTAGATTLFLLVLTLVLP